MACAHRRVLYHDPGDLLRLGRVAWKSTGPHSGIIA